MSGVRIRKYGNMNIADMHRWGGQCLVFPRDAIVDAQRLPALQRPGLYILYDTEPRVYIREAQNITELRRDAEQKSSWTNIAVITTKPVVGQYRFSGLAEQWKYLRAVLIGLVKSAKQAKLDNLARDMEIPPLTDDLVMEAELFLAGALMCLHAVGLTFFQKETNR